MGQSTEGIYAEDPYANVHPSVLVQYYGVHGAPAIHLGNQTGAGHPEDEDAVEEDEDMEWEDEDVLLEELENTVADHVESNIRHPPVKVARALSPFQAAADEVQFRELLQAAQEEEYLPVGYGIAPEEWAGDVYPERETLRIGTRGISLTVDLPPEVWYPRALMWAQGLDLLTRMLDVE